MGIDSGGTYKKKRGRLHHAISAYAGCARGSDYNNIIIYTERRVATRLLINFSDKTAFPPILVFGIFSPPRSFALIDSRSPCKRTFYYCKKNKRVRERKHCRWCICALNYILPLGRVVRPVAYRIRYLSLLYYKVMASFVYLRLRIYFAKSHYFTALYRRITSSKGRLL